MAENIEETEKIPTTSTHDVRTASTTEAAPPAVVTIQEIPTVYFKKKEEDILEPYRGEMTKSDASLFPSYTNFIIPYRVECRQRYIRSGKIQRQQFLKEHSSIEMMQPRALDGVRFHREFCDNVLKPVPKKNLVQLTEKEQRRLQYIMENKIL